MSILGLICVLLALVATLLFVLFLFQRRDLRAISQLSLTVQRALSGERLPQRIEIEPQSESQLDVQALGASVNQLLTRTARSAGREKSGPKLFTELGERIHEAVLVHRDVILYANSQFASFVGVSRVDLIDRRLADIVAPEYADLVAENLRRRLAGAHGAERFEVEMVGLQGQVSLLELTTAQIEFEGAPALLVTGVEVIPTRKLRAIASGKIDEKEAAARAALVAPPLPAPPPPAPPVQVSALQSLAEAIVTTDLEGHLVYLNPAAERLLNVGRAQAMGRQLEEIVGIVDQNDRKLLADPVREAIGGGNGDPHTLTRRAVLLGKASGEERAIELAASPLRDHNGELTGAVVLLHDVTELRGLHRQMSYQATHDALTGLVNRLEFERRLEEAADVARRGEATHMLCYLDLDRFKIVNDSSGHLAGDSMLRDVAKLLRDAVRDSDTVSRLGGDEFGDAAGRLPARQGAPDRRRRLPGGRRLSLRVARPRVQHRRLRRPHRDRPRGWHRGATARRGRFGLLRGEKRRRRARVGVLRARRSAGARQRRDRVAAEAAVGDQGRALRAVLPAHRRGLRHRHRGAIDGSAAAHARRVGPRDRCRRNSCRPPNVSASWHRSIAGWCRPRCARCRAMPSSWRATAAWPSTSRARPWAIRCSWNSWSSASMAPAYSPSRSVSKSPRAPSSAISSTRAVSSGVLHGMGCKFTIDDFGSGVGSFSSLKNLELDYLKLDGSFMRNLARDSVSQTMVTAMIKLARTLNFKIIAEQVEDSAALDAARNIGVDYVQGFVIARPARLATAA